MDLAHLLQEKSGIPLTPDQLKNKWDSLRQTYKVERKKEQCTGTAPSTWEFFDRMSELLSQTPKVRGLVGGFDGESFTDAPDIEDEVNEEDDAMQEGAEDIDNRPTGLESPIHPSSEPLPGMNGQGNGSTSHFTEGDNTLGPDLKEALAYHTDAVKEIEMRRIEADKERMQQALEMQLQMARILAEGLAELEGLVEAIEEGINGAKKQGDADGEEQVFDMLEDGAFSVLRRIVVNFPGGT
ncbi:hypothetical protein L7F22_025665 [Adiantum nelumboides]|nr:hypothetical protein [Adiantum nelumboides]